MSAILEYEHNGQRWLFVKVPEYGNAKAWINPSISNFLHVDHTGGYVYHIEVPSENWQIHAETSNLTEEQAREMVIHTTKFELYNDYSNTSGLFTTPIESIHSLIRSKGGDANKRYVVLKEVK